jgi:uncharacterized membrane protein
MSDDDFKKQLESRRTSALGDLVGFLRENKKWWLGPIVIAIVLLGLLVLLGGTGAAPFIYTLF